MELSRGWSLTRGLPCLFLAVGAQLLPSVDKLSSWEVGGNLLLFFVGFKQIEAKPQWTVGMGLMRSSTAQELYSSVLCDKVLY